MTEERDWILDWLDGSPVGLRGNARALRGQNRHEEAGRLERIALLKESVRPVVVEDKHRWRSVVLPKWVRL
jgi:hypothetical protein